MSSNVIIIPTLNPTDRLIKLVESLKDNFKYIIIINDGSNIETKYIFDKLKKLNCIIENHKTNLGKGQAIKTGIKRALTIKGIAGFITVDSDGQHTIEDIIKISNELDNYRESIILGTRNFKEKQVPIRSRIGNKFSSMYFYLQTNIKCKDTQTGLRAIPIKYANLALQTEGTRYEYEMNFLLAVVHSNINLKYIPIKTIYEDNNKSSHFRTIIDSVIIYKKLLIFIFMSLLCAIIDIISFHILIKLSLSIMLSTIISRIISGIINFILNKNITFKTKHNTLKESISYLILFFCIMLLSGILVNILSIIPINLILLKVIVDITLFILSYFIQTRYIFKCNRNR